MNLDKKLKLLVVDDEYAIRENLKRNIDWKGNKIELAGCAEDGVEAVEWIEKSQPDVVLTDIRMPGMDGIQLSKWIKEHYPLIKVIFLSAYSDFDYAKSALKYEVADYLLKPVNSVQLLEILNEIRKEIVREGNERIKNQAITALIEKNINFLREKYLRDVLEGRYEKNIDEILQMDGFNFTDSTFMLTLIAIENYQDENGNDPGNVGFDGLKLEMEKYIRKSCKDTFKIYVFNENHQSIGIVWADSANNESMLSSEDVINWMNHLREDFLENNHVLTIGVSSLHTGLHTVKDAYREASRALKAKFYLGRGRIIHFAQLQSNQSNIYLENHETENIYEAMKNYDWIQTQLSLKRYFDYYAANSNILEEYPDFITYELISVLKRVIAANLCSPETFIDKETVNELISTNSLNEMHIKAVHIFKRIYELMEGCRINGQSHIIREIKDYVQQNYMHRITLEQAGKSTYMSASALSKLFFKGNGILFSDYVSRVRIDKAREYLLRTDSKIYEVSEKVGFRDVKYFNKLFKKMIGMTPAEFKKKSRSTEKKN